MPHLFRQQDTLLHVCNNFSFKELLQGTGSCNRPKYKHIGLDVCIIFLTTVLVQAFNFAEWYSILPNTHGIFREYPLPSLQF
jgi:hypothetical protein